MTPVVSALATMLWVAAPAAPLPPYSLTAVLEPAQPRDNDLVSITLSGTWPDMGVPSQSRHEVAGDAITIDAGGAGLPAAQIPSAWACTENLGTLPPGTYQVLGSVYRFRGTDPYGLLAGGPDLVATFVVTPDPAGLLVLAAGGALAVRRRRW